MTSPTFRTPILEQISPVIAPYEVRFPPMTDRSMVHMAVDLRPTIAEYGLAIRDQHQRSYCSVHAITFLLEYLYNSRSIAGVTALSEEYLNYVAHLLTGDVGADGDFFDKIDNGYRTYGIVLETDFPEQESPPKSIDPALLERGKRWFRMRSVFIKQWGNEYGATTTQLEQACAFLDDNTPVALGAWFPKSGGYTYHFVDGVPLLDVPPPSAKNQTIFDGHSVALVGYQRGGDFPGGGYFIFRNSWGVDTFGDAGYAYLPFSYVTSFANDLLAYELPG